MPVYIRSLLSTCRFYILMTYLYRQSEASSWGVTTAFLGGSKTWADGVYGLDALFNRGLQNLNLSAFNSLLFDNGWLGESTDYFRGGPTIELGDVGYRTENGRFVVVTNIHTTLMSENSNSLVWEVDPYLETHPKMQWS